VSAAQVGIRALAGVFLFTLLMITREGMETALLMGTLVAQGSGAVNLMLGAPVGSWPRRRWRGCGRATGTA
jgi:high-affinity Fe2+/Pb2+ permease